MGGDHHGHAKIKIPEHTIYKVEAIPELMAVRRALAQKGLKDPWLRNEVWKYDRTQRGTTYQIFRKTFGRGMLIGFVAAVVTTAAEKMWRAGQDHGHGHGEGHH